METWSNMKLSLDSGFLMACAACDHVQRIWINLLISWNWMASSKCLNFMKIGKMESISLQLPFWVSFRAGFGHWRTRAACGNALPDETPRIKLQMPGLSVPSATTVPERINGAGLKELLGRHLMQWLMQCGKASWNDDNNMLTSMNNNGEERDAG